MAGKDSDVDALLEQAPPKRRKPVLLLGGLAMVVILEAVVVFVLVKSFSPAASPAAAHASAPATPEPGGIVTTEGEKKVPRVEIKVGEFRAQNRRGQQSYLLQFSVFAVAKDNEKPRIEEIVASKAATIKDRFSRVVRGMDPERFVEPDLTTLRTQLKEELSQVLGSELNVEEVLLTEFTSAVEN